MNEEIAVNVSIFGWDVWRIFRDDKKEIIKIVLHRGNEFKEFENTSWRERTGKND